MNKTLETVLRKFVLVFFDDILIYSKTKTDHLVHLSIVLDLLRKDHWQVKLSKCSFAQQSLAYLGHVVTSSGVSTDPSKILEIQTWKIPSNVKELRFFRPCWLLHEICEALWGNC